MSSFHRLLVLSTDVCFTIGVRCCEVELRCPDEEVVPVTPPAEIWILTRFSSRLGIEVGRLELILPTTLVEEDAEDAERMWCEDVAVELPSEEVMLEPAKNFLRCSATVDDEEEEVIEDVMGAEWWCSSDSEAERLPIVWIVSDDRPLPGEVLLLITVDVDPPLLLVDTLPGSMLSLSRAEGEAAASPPPPERRSDSGVCPPTPVEVASDVFAEAALGESLSSSRECFCAAFPILAKTDWWCFDS